MIFNIGDQVYLRVSPTKGVQRFGIKGKLAPRYIGPFPIQERCGPVAYRLDFEGRLPGVHNVFHVSQLKKCLKASVNIPISAVENLQEDLSYIEHPVRIVDQKNRMTRYKSQPFFKVQWSNHTEDEATWETEEFLKTHYPEFFASQIGTYTPPLPRSTFKSRDEISCSGGEL